jgi:hypothetical protein
MKKHFNDLFEINGISIQPKVTIGIKGTQVPQGVGFMPGVIIGNIDFFKHKDSFFEVIQEEDIHIITFIY